MRAFLSLLCLLLFGGVCNADEFYCMFFATDSIQPKHCHVWGTFTQMKGDKLVKEVTISWSPRGSWNWWDSKQDGYHMSLKSSMDLSAGKTTCIWGPYEIKEELFQKANEEYRASGDYKMVDVYSRPAVNCIHKLTEITGKRKITHFRYGKCAAASVYRHYHTQGLIEPTKNGDAVIKALGLSGYRLRYM